MSTKTLGTLAAGLAVAALVPAASGAEPGGGAYGQHLPAPSQSEVGGGGAYGQHLPANGQPVDSSLAASSDDSSSNWDDIGIVAGILGVGLGGTVLFTRRRNHVRTAAVSR